MATESLLDLTNHVFKCRLCMREFELDDTQIKITAIVKIRFFELTQIQVLYKKDFLQELLTSYFSTSA